MNKAPFILCAILSLSVQCTFAWDAEPFYSFGLGTNGNTGNLTITTPTTTQKTQSGSTSYEIKASYGKKHYLNNFTTGSWEMSIGYDSLHANILSRTNISGSSLANIYGKTGLNYTFSGFIGLERGDYTLYTRSGLRVTRWSLNIDDPNGLLLPTTPVVTKKKTTTTPGMGMGIQIALSDSMSGRLDYTYYLPAKLTYVSTHSGFDCTVTKKISQQIVSFSIVY